MSSRAMRNDPPHPLNPPHPLRPSVLDASPETTMPARQRCRRKSFSSHRESMPNEPLIEEQLTESVIGAYYDVYNTLGFGFLEQVYTMALERELRARGHAVSREVYVSVRYKDEELCKQRIDMIVDDRLIIETKSTELLHKSALRQVYNYLRATQLQVGLLLHFGPEPAFYRQVHSHETVPAPRSRNRPLG
jgi:GxxExxY protein